MVLVHNDGTDERFPTQCRDVHDVTGAGDMVLAVIGLCQAAGWPLTDSARLANIAAGLEVERLGAAQVSRKELITALRASFGLSLEKRVTPEHLAVLVEEYRREGRRIVFTNGCFDLLHRAHLACLQEAAGLGDVLIVAINSDASVRRLKGPSRPVIPEAERAALVAGLACVGHVVVFDEDTPLSLLRQIQPDVLVKGGTTAEVVGQDYVESYGGQVHRTLSVPELSTTRLLAQLRGTTAARPFELSPFEEVAH